MRPATAMAKRESVAKTLAVAAGVALFCSLLVSATVYWLRPIQLAYRSLDEDRAIVIAAGLATPEQDLADGEIVSRYLRLEPRLVDLDTGEFAEVDAATARNYAFRSAADDPLQSRAIADELDLARLGRRPRLMPVYVLRDGEALQRLVLPVFGRGMWSMIYGFVSLESDLTTIAGIYFHEHGETPGIGDRIEDPAWTSSWAGKRVYADDGAVVLRVGGGAAPRDRERVDAITGATITVQGVDGLIRYWFGGDGYGPFLTRLRGRSRS